MDDTCTSDNSYELSGEMENVNNQRQHAPPRKGVASTYFDQRITIPRDKGDDQHDVSVIIITFNEFITLL